MAATKSPWRLRSRAALRAALDALPPGADLKTARSAIAAAYPFGERRGHPYQCWLKERKLALERRGWGRQPAPQVPVPMTIGLRLRPSDGRAWLDVHCDWCQEAHMGAAGCVSCLRHRALVAEAARDDDFRRLARQALLDAVSRLMLLDRVEELTGLRPEVAGSWPGGDAA